MMTEKNGIVVHTLGCRLNSYESEVMRDLADQAGLDNAVIINTCAVTLEAERQARQLIRKIRKENQSAKIIVTGCAAQIKPDSFATMPEVDQVIGNDEKMKAESYLSSSTEKILVNDIMSVKETASHLLSSFQDRARAFVQVQNGCDHRCTFCRIPFGRGNSRSVPIGEIVSQIRLLVENGYQEIVITGVDITSYGSDLPGKPSLGQMLKRLLTLVPNLQRLRLSSIDSVEIDDDLMALITHEHRLMPHLHLSLQAGDNMILKRMKRRHMREDAIKICKQLRKIRPDITFGADIIAGFPTETDEMFENSLKLIDECGLSFLHVFPYSAVPDTPAARMPQVDKKIRKERAALLRQKGEEALTQLLQSRIGQTANVLIEQNGFGRTEHYLPVQIDSNQFDHQLIQVKLVSTDGKVIRGTLI